MIISCIILHFFFLNDSLTFLLLARADKKWPKPKNNQFLSAVLLRVRTYSSLMRFGVSANQYLQNAIKNERKWSSRPTASLRPFSSCSLCKTITFQPIRLHEAFCRPPYMCAIYAFHMLCDKLQENHCWTLQKTTISAQVCQKLCCWTSPIIFSRSPTLKSLSPFKKIELPINYEKHRGNIMINIWWSIFG